MKTDLLCYTYEYNKGLFYVFANEKKVNNSSVFFH